MLTVCCETLETLNLHSNSLMSWQCSVYYIWLNPRGSWRNLTEYFLNTVSFLQRRSAYMLPCLCYLHPLFPLLGIEMLFRSICWVLFFSFFFNRNSLKLKNSPLSWYHILNSTVLYRLTANKICRYVYALLVCVELWPLISSEMRVAGWLCDLFKGPVCKNCMNTFSVYWVC